MYAIVANLSINKELEDLILKNDPCKAFFYFNSFSFHITLVSDIESLNIGSLSRALDFYFRPIINTKIELLHPFVLAMDKFYLGLRWKMNAKILGCIKRFKKNPDQLSYTYLLDSFNNQNFLLKTTLVNQEVELSYDLYSFAQSLKDFNNKDFLIESISLIFYSEESEDKVIRTVC